MYEATLAQGHSDPTPPSVTSRSIVAIDYTLGYAQVNAAARQAQQVIANTIRFSTRGRI